VTRSRFARLSVATARDQQRRWKMDALVDSLVANLHDLELTEPARQRSFAPVPRSSASPPGIAAIPASDME
jgi:hypothetical protein